MDSKEQVRAEKRPLAAHELPELKRRDIDLGAVAPAHPAGSESVTSAPNEDKIVAPTNGAPARQEPIKAEPVSQQPVKEMPVQEPKTQTPVSTTPTPEKLVKSEDREKKLVQEAESKEVKGAEVKGNASDGATVQSAADAAAAAAATATTIASATSSAPTAASTTNTAPITVATTAAAPTTTTAVAPATVPAPETPQRGSVSSVTSSSGVPHMRKNQASSFIHKLYSMLEDQTLNSIIWWHSNKSSFFVAPNEEFTRVLSQNFKHANVASFIRQLNMYGFHKVNDSNGDGGDSDTSLTPRSRKGSASSIGGGGAVWEFKHSSGWFRQGNLEGLGMIKRRSFRNNSASQAEREVHSIKMPVQEDASAQNYTPRSAPHQIDQDSQSQARRIYQQQVQHYAETDMRIAELQRSNSTLVRQTELIKDELANANYDQVALIDIFKDFVTQTARAYPDSPLKDSCVNVMQGLDYFKGNILQRSATRDMAMRNLNEPQGYVPFGTTPPPTTGIPQGPPPGVGQPGMAYPAAAAGAAAAGAPAVYAAVPETRPVLHNDIRYSVSSNRSRNLSVFDPIQPLPSQNTGGPGPMTSGPPPSAIPPGAIAGPPLGPGGFAMRTFSPGGPQGSPTEGNRTRSSSNTSQLMYMQMAPNQALPEQGQPQPVPPPPPPAQQQQAPTAPVAVVGGPGPGPVPVPGQPVPQPPYTMYNPPRSVPAGLAEKEKMPLQNSRSNSIESTHSVGHTVYSLLNHSATPKK